MFAAAWMASLGRQQKLGTFLSGIASELAKGFVTRSINLGAAKLLLPSYTRTNLLAETFDRTLIHGMRLSDLPERPLLCVNTSVMNTGQLGRFSRDGFSSTGIQPPGQDQGPSNPAIALPEFPVALAAMASAAFPVGLPPVYLRSGAHIPAGWGGPSSEHRRFALIDGGVLDKLGVQTLLRSRRFGTWDLIISDAERKEQPWKPGGIGNFLRGAIMGITSLPIIERFTAMMNSKETRHMRSSAFGELERTWLIHALRTNGFDASLDDYLSAQPIAPRRRILFVRLSQTLKDLLASVPRWRLRELAARGGQSLPEPLPPIQELLRRLGVELRRSLEIHAAIGGDARVGQLNRIGTHFGALSARDIEDLAAHACWQVHIMRALYWD